MECEDIPEVPVVRLCPEVLVGRGSNQLYVNAHPTPGRQYRPFQHRIHIQLPRDLRQASVDVLVVHY